MRRTGSAGAPGGRRARVALVALLALTLAGCGGDDPPAASPSAAGSSAPASSPPSSAPAGSPTPSLPAGCTAPPPAPAGAVVVTATVAGTSVTTERERYDVPLGSPVRLLVTTDAADEVHVHGYDLRAATAPGCPTALDFTANVPGSVEVELERSHLELFELRSR